MSEKTMKTVLLSLLILSINGLINAQENPLEQLNHYIGTWGPPPGDPIIERDPKLKDLKVIDFEWGVDKRVIWSKTGIYPDGEEAVVFSEGMITYNPTSKKLEWLEYQIMNEILFEGEYSVLEGNKVQRIYTVYYAEGYKEIPYPELEGWTRKFKETFIPTSEDGIDWITEAWIGGKWVEHGQRGMEFKAVRDK